MINRKRRPMTYLNRWLEKSERLTLDHWADPMATLQPYWKNCTNDASIMVFDTRSGSTYHNEWVKVHAACEANFIAVSSRS